MITLAPDAEKMSNQLFTILEVVSDLDQYEQLISNIPEEIVLATDPRWKFDDRPPINIVKEILQPADDSRRRNNWGQLNESDSSVYAFSEAQEIAKKWLNVRIMLSIGLFEEILRDNSRAQKIFKKLADESDPANDLSVLEHIFLKQAKAIEDVKAAFTQIERRLETNRGLLQRAIDDVLPGLDRIKDTFEPNIGPGPALPPGQERGEKWYPTLEDWQSRFEESFSQPLRMAMRITSQEIIPALDTARTIWKTLETAAKEAAAKIDKAATEDAKIEVLRNIDIKASQTEWLMIASFAASAAKKMKPSDSSKNAISLNIESTANDHHALNSTNQNLAPDLLETSGDLAKAYNLLFHLRSFFTFLETAELGAIASEPQWLKDVKEMVTNGRAIVARWRIDLPDIMAPIYASFSSYESIFSVIAEDPPTSSENWVLILEELQKELNAQQQEVKAALGKMASYQNELRGFHTDLKDKISEVRAAHEEAHQKLERIEFNLGQVLVKINDYTQDMNAADLNAGKETFSTAVTIALPIVLEGGESFPFVGVAMGVLGVGKSVYDIVVSDHELQKSLDRYTSLLDDEAEDIQALSNIHALIFMLDHLDETYHSITNPLPDFERLWENESTKLGSMIDALNADAKPDKLPELQHLSAADFTWKALMKIVNSMMETPTPTNPVYLTPRKPEIQIQDSFSNDQLNPETMSEKKLHPILAFLLKLFHFIIGKKTPQEELAGDSPSNTSNDTMLVPGDSSTSGSSFTSSDLKDKTWAGFMACKIIDAKCHGIIETHINPLDPKPDWFDDLDAHIKTAQEHAKHWIYDLSPDISSAIPSSISTYNAVFSPVIDEMIKEFDAANKSSDPAVKKKTITNALALVKALKDQIGEIDDTFHQMTQNLKDLQKNFQSDEDTLNSSTGDIQKAIVGDSNQIDKLNDAIATLHTEIRHEEDQVKASAVSAGAGVFVLVAAIGLTIATEGAAAPLIGVGIATMAGGSAGWGVWQSKIDKAKSEIRDDESTVSELQQQIMSLGVLGISVGITKSSIDDCITSLTALQTSWGVLTTEIDNVVAQLNKPNPDLLAVLDLAAAKAAKNNWDELADYATEMTGIVAKVEKKNF